MPEHRFDPCGGRWVIIAEDRAGRPSEFLWQPQRRSIERCPFCVGHEDQTPATIAMYPSSSTLHDWQVRVIPNKYPAAVSKPFDVLPSEPARPEVHDAACLSSLFLSRPATGVHEVIIESPDHVASFAELSSEQARWSVMAYRDRLQLASQNPDIAFGLVFKNCRGAGGATLEHAHSQVLATSVLPSEPEQEIERFRDHFQRHGRCLQCDLLAEERLAKVRIVAESDRFVVFCPFASRFPFETWIVPRRHFSRFEAIESDEAIELAGLLQQQIVTLEKLFPELAYNFWFQSAPFAIQCEEFFHWRAVIIARTSTQAGYEWGSGCFVNPVAPESAAEQLRRSAIR